MSDLSNNIRFSYLYRDSGNHKLFGEEIFSNNEQLKLDEIESRIRAKLIDGEFFNPLTWEIAKLNFENHDNELDHDWHEFEMISITRNEQTSLRSIVEFLKIIEL